MTTLTIEQVRQLCGSTHATWGASYLKQGRVVSLVRVVQNPATWHAKVRGSVTYQVRITKRDKWVTDCTCPAFTPKSKCKHVAAVLYAIARQMEREQKLAGPAAKRPAAGPTPQLPASQATPTTHAPQASQAPRTTQTPQVSHPAPHTPQISAATRATPTPQASQQTAQTPRTPQAVPTAQTTRTSQAPQTPQPATRTSQAPQTPQATPTPPTQQAPQQPNPPQPQQAPQPPTQVEHTQPHDSAGQISEAARRLLVLFRNASEQGLRAEAGAISPLHAVHARQDLCVEWFCQPSSTYRGNWMRLEMKIGPKRTYVIKDIRAFLRSIERGTPHFFTSKFTYDEREFRFSDSDRPIVDLLLQVVREERAYRVGIFGHDAYDGPSVHERSLLLPPTVWQQAFPLLQGATSFVEHKGSCERLKVESGPLPLQIQVTEQLDHFDLVVIGLDAITPLPQYGCAAAGTTLYQSSTAQIQQLADLVQLYKFEPRRNTKSLHITMTSADLAPFASEILPKLRQMATVNVSPRVQMRLVEQPLVTRIYLDHADERLSARVVYAYGDVVFHAQSTAVNPVLDPDLVVVRDTAAEADILYDLEQAGFTPAENDLYLEGEAPVYDFLFDDLPILQTKAEVYCTAAVDRLTTARVVRPKSKLDISSSQDWLDVSFDLDGLSDHDIRAVLRSLVEKKRYHRLRDGSIVRLDEEGFASLSQLVESLGVGASDLRGTNLRGGRLRLPTLRALSMVDNEPGRSGQVHLGKSLRAWLDALRNPDSLEFPLPESLKTTMRDYQTYGFQWLKTLSHFGFGGILADDMGLGKTLQTIAYLLSERTSRQPDTPALVVCPASLTFNWKSEFERFAPQLKAVVVAGDASERARIVESGSEVDVLITSYPLLWRDVQMYEEHTFDALILDEAQAIKNHTTQTAQAVNAIASPRRFALTGTPVENALEDLWSIFHAVFKDLFGSRESFSRLDAEAVAKRARPFLLRRLKKDVLTELPDKIETLQTADMSRDQKKIYLAYLAQIQAETAKQLAGEGFQKGRFQILAGLTRLRQVCCHPALCVENYSGTSGKLDQLLELVDEYIGAGQRILIFSQFTSMLGIIQTAFAAQGVPYLYLDGSTPARERLALCQRFNEGDVPVFLISLKAGGTGLNLTGADTVILYDLWWNPAVEEQAADRAHRIGQKKTVQVIRMVTAGTIEEKMHQLQEQKRDLIDQVVGSGQAGGDASGLGALTEADVRAVLGL